MLDASKISHWSRVLCTALGMIVSSGCTLFVPRLRPVAGADRNLWCVLEYRPDPTHDGPDLLFMAAANPYKTEEAYMNPLEALVHGVFAPGRHLSAPVKVRGAVCESPWQAGHRIPMLLTESHYLLCRRQSLAEVRISVVTRWGACTSEIPAGDNRPRCRPSGSPPNNGQHFMSQVVCSP
jgi:hypothetical protein